MSGREAPRLTHVRANVRDLPSAITWYEDLLGVQAQGHWPPDAPTYAHFTLGPTQFALGQPSQPATTRLNGTI
ncbi:VOC family protein [Kribbella sp. NBC_00889]|uniref:VOC family protein n=1 Tax=Kribbella sp. NBC_00889 TaxID=2975974 RepID=UPI003869089B|nr:VOC family protein [Kribbella sp. NBC_00889]